MTAKLFGLENSNRDFSQANSWGKNQFNSSFPAALCCYMEQKGLRANYIKTSTEAVMSIGEIPISDMFGTKVLDENSYFAFEATHTPFQKYVVGTLPRTDLVIQDQRTSQCLRGMEIKLTALPDNTTHALTDDLFGSEIVVRPDSIVYLACSIIESISDKEKLKSILKDELTVADWNDYKEVISYVPHILSCLRDVLKAASFKQTPFLLQPIWKTEGKNPKLSINCLDVFVWSDAAFVQFILQISNEKTDLNRMTRQTRSAVWLYKMLSDYVYKDKFNHALIIDNLSYNTKNDKAFASSGNVTNTYMSCDNLKKPRILSSEIKNIILGGGQHLLSPERRFDAIIYNSPYLFEE